MPSWVSWLWDLIKDPDNRTVLSWLGGGVAVVIGLIWAVFKSSKSAKLSIEISAGRTITLHKLDDISLESSREYVEEIFGHLSRQSATEESQRVEDIDRGGVRASGTRPPGLPTAPEATRLPDSGSSGERQFGIWLSERMDDRRLPLSLGETYELNFKVGSPVQGNLAEGDTTVPSSDVPPEGLQTYWVVMSSQVEFASGSPQITVSSKPIEGGTIWTAKFSLLIPHDGESDISRYRITPRLAQDTQLDVFVFVGKQLYRELSVRLAIAREISTTSRASEPISTIADRIDATLAHMGLKTTHEWTTPPGELSVVVAGSVATVNGDVGTQRINGDVVQWTAVSQLIGGTIKNVRESAERLREHAENHFDDIDPDDLAGRLAAWQPEYDWSNLADHADSAHRRRWDDIKVGKELRDLAYDGRQLFDACFPAGTELRRWIEALAPGHRLNISLTRKSVGTYVPSVPWGLMYLQDVPPPGQPVDPMGFMGLRFRIGYAAYAVQEGSKDLGGLNDTHRTHYLYWGNDAQDVTGREARWQEQQWRSWQNQIFVPGAQQGVTPKDQLLQSIDDPRPAPVSVLYVFCQCTVGQGNDPVLRFGGTKNIADVVGRTELSTRQLKDRPLVFANACTTAASDPYYSNELERIFFDRGCRAFLGTETKVPITFASRFASIFFHFFYRKIDPAPMAAGEAVAQTRLFLWTNYRNIGGLFYTYVNQYELFMAQNSEVLSLRR